MSPHSGTQFVTLIALFTSAILPAGETSAQGLSGASLEVAVVRSDGVALSGATVTVSESRSGLTRRTTSGAAGRAVFDNLPVGAYTLEARLLGLLPASLSGMLVRLGDRVRVKLVMGDAGAAQDIGEVSVTSTFRDPGAGGPAGSLSRAEVTALPLMNRDFVGLLGMSSHATGPQSLWVSGQHPRLNAIQVDGTTGNDLFGVNVTPAGGAGGKAITLETLEEVRILVAPFDVRQGGFSGGLINAVTRSGSNITRGAVFTSYSRAELVGADTAGAELPAFDQLQYGLSHSGPVIRDRLHYFITGEAQFRRSAYSGPSAADPATGVSEQTARRAAAAVRDMFGFDPGGPEAPALEQPNANLFFKLSWNPSSRNTVEVTQSVVNARSDGLNRSSVNAPNVDGWQLSKSGSVTRGSSYITRVKASSVSGSFSNEAIASLSRSVHSSDSRNDVPLFIVGADIANTFLAAGAPKASQATRTSYQTIELTNNLSWSKDAHVVTLGTQNLLLSVEDNFFLGAWGVWTFDNVSALENNQPSRYEVAQPLVEGGPRADYSANLFSAYAQDSWSVNDRLHVTAGVRLDVPYVESPRQNASLAANASLGRIQTGDFPTGNSAFAPRIGFSWTVGGERRTMLRGGAGIFTGRPPFAWLTGAFSNTGQEQSTLVCRSVDGVPKPTTDISALPYACLSAQAPRALPRVTFFDPAYRFPQSLKYAAGLDHRFGKSIVASLDVIHTRSRHDTYVSDMNLVERGASSEGRMMYGSIGGLGAARPTRLDSLGFGPVYHFGNVSGDRSTSVSISARRSWASGALVQAEHTWSRTRDVMSMAGFIGDVILRNNPIDGTLAKRVLRRSSRDVPHTVIATALIPAGRGFTTSAVMRIRSGTPYAFTVIGDANADGVVRNDLVYIPRDSSDISLSNPDTYLALDRFIESMPCIRAQRGQVVSRNSCRNPTAFILDSRIAKRLGGRKLRGMELSADLFNLPNMLRPSWGLVRETSSREDAPLLSITGWDAAKNRPRYSVPTGSDGQPILAQVDKAVPDPSRWRVQLGVRYDF